MKKFLALVLALCMVLALCACGKAPAPAAEEKAEEVVEEVEEKVEEAVEEPAEEAEAAPEASVEFMTHDEFVAAELNTEVALDCYVQAHESWWDNKITVYVADGNGDGYLLYDLACSEEDAGKLEVGTEIIVNGYKGEWSGQIEVTDGTFEFVEDGDTYIADPVDVTNLYGTDELANHMSSLISVKGLVIAEDVNSEWDCSEDLYINVTLNDESYVFTLRRYLTDNNSEAYAQVKDLKAGDVIDVEAFLYWYEGPQARIVFAEKQA